MTRAEIAELDRHARRHLGKPLGSCTRDDLEALAAWSRAEAARLEADVDRADAAICDAQDCGCAVFAVPRRPDGGHDIGRARVRHTRHPDHERTTP